MRTRTTRGMNPALHGGAANVMMERQPRLTTGRHERKRPTKRPASRSSNRASGAAIKPLWKALNRTSGAHFQGMATMVYVSGYLRIRHRRVERVRPHLRTR